MKKRKLALRARPFFLLCFVYTLLWSSPAFCADVTLAWDPNSESDLEGYGVYFKKGVPGPPFDLFGYVTVGELDNADSPTVSVTGLDKGARYYFAVTAYDTDGNESYFSSSACADVGDTIVPCPSGGEGGSGGGGGGSGGGAGCFIEAAGDGNHAAAAVVVAFLGLSLTAIRRRRKIG